ncbi:aldo/keto reductase [Polyangium jinanense]|uniref:Aldo/keto reductase n=1 Tax=Polyangium jinanense TaxID=2829994 RepID=A0A9X3X214_9BACT|nr:aldo/keto reductase [Polyangium jinanense]MDC3957320.1 aldo/keto reductase [Polyangium jinanense]MDC3982722.1 aldo/keto reductase [Polyangium jinanense]
MADELSRRGVLKVVAAAAAVASCKTTSSGTTAGAGETSAAPPAPASPSIAATPVSAGTRTLGRTGAPVEPVSLGGEGILRTWNREREAVPMILEALRLGVRYCDTAPAYAGSLDYYGEAFRQAPPGARDQVFLASKTHERSRDGSLRLLDESLKRLGTNRLDLWQLHDLRTREDLDEIFGKGGAIQAVEAARKDGRIRFVGITGHHDPAILVEAMQRYDFDTVLCAVNPADPARLPFLTTVVPEARKRGMGVIGMKVMAAGRILADGAATPEELIGYGAHFADTVIVGMRSPAEVRQNLAIGRALAPPTKESLAALERRLAPRADEYSYFKA